MAQLDERGREIADRIDAALETAETAAQEAVEELGGFGDPKRARDLLDKAARAADDAVRGQERLDDLV